MSSEKILIVHPYARSTFFLNRIKNHILNHAKLGVHYFSVKPNERSHIECLEKIKKQPINSFIVFLGHGRNDRLFGGRGDKALASVGENAKCESPDDYYNNEDFINENNIDVFKEKKVFCLACNSNDKISDYAMRHNTIAFLGFGDIPTSIGEFTEKRIKVSLDMIRLLKTEINYIIKKSLVFAIQNRYTFSQLADIINFITNQCIVNTLINKKWFKERYLLADYLYFLKREMKIKGDKNSRLVD